MAKCGRHTHLNEIKQCEVAAVVSMGCGLSAAADYVGCNVSTISRTAARDPKFAAILARAKSRAELNLVKNIHSAADDKKYWRAAAWALERFFPERYGKRSPGVVSQEQLADYLSMFAEMIMVQDMPESQQKAVIKATESIIYKLGQDAAQMHRGASDQGDK